MKKLSRLLVEKSQEAFILGLETYNRLSVRYRIEAFCFLFCNSWELLLKARLLDQRKDDKAIYYPKKRGQPRKSLSLRDCLQRIWTNARDPIRRNIEDIAEIRDAAVHLIVPELEKVYSGLFQAGVLNYVKHLNEWFHVSITDKCSPALLSLVANVEDVDPVKLKNRYTKSVLTFFEEESKRIDNADREMSDLTYRIPVEYKLVLTKSSSDADISLVSGNGSKQGLVLEVPKDIDRTHPYLQSDVIREVQARLPNGVSFNQYDVQCIIYKEKIKGNHSYHYRITKPHAHRYSERFVELILEKVNSDPSYLSRARESFRRRKGTR